MNNWKPNQRARHRTNKKKGAFRVTKVFKTTLLSMMSLSLTILIACLVTKVTCLSTTSLNSTTWSCITCDIVLDVNLTIASNDNDFNYTNSTEWNDNIIEYLVLNTLKQIFLMALLHNEADIIISYSDIYEEDIKEANFSLEHYIFTIAVNFTQENDFENFTLFYQHHWFSTIFSYMLQTDINTESECNTYNINEITLISEQIEWISKSQDIGNANECKVSSNSLFADIRFYLYILFYVIYLLLAYLS